MLPIYKKKKTTLNIIVQIWCYFVCIILL